MGAGPLCICNQPSSPQQGAQAHPNRCCHNLGQCKQERVVSGGGRPTKTTEPCKTPQAPKKPPKASYEPSTPHPPGQNLKTSLNP